MGPALSRKVKETTLHRKESLSVKENARNIEHDKNSKGHDHSVETKEANS